MQDISSSYSDNIATALGYELYKGISGDNVNTEFERKRFLDRIKDICEYMDAQKNTDIHSNSKRSKLLPFATSIVDSSALTKSLCSSLLSAPTPPQIKIKLSILNYFSDPNDGRGYAFLAMKDKSNGFVGNRETCRTDLISFSKESTTELNTHFIKHAYLHYSQSLNGALTFDSYSRKIILIDEFGAEIPLINDLQFGWVDSIRVAESGGYILFNDGNKLLLAEIKGRQINREIIILPYRISRSEKETINCVAALAEIGFIYISDVSLVILNFSGENVAELPIVSTNTHSLVSISISDTTSLLSFTKRLNGDDSLEIVKVSWVSNRLEINSLASYKISNSNKYLYRSTAFYDKYNRDLYVFVGSTNGIIKVDIRTFKLHLEEERQIKEINQFSGLDIGDEIWNLQMIDDMMFISTLNSGKFIRLQVCYTC